MGNKKKIHWFQVLAATAVALAAVFAVAVWRAQPEIAFNPAPKLIADPSIYELSFEPVRVQGADLSVAGWLVHAPEPSRGVVLCCPGSSGNRSYEMDTVMFFTKAGFDVLMFDYPGFADSVGKMTEQNCYKAARMMFDRLSGPDVAGPRIIYGRGRGAAVAAHLAGERDADAVVLEAAYSSFKDLMRLQVGWTHHLLMWTFPTCRFLKKVEEPVLFVHSKVDREVPIAEGRKVFEAFDGRKEFFETGGLHGDTITVCAPAYEEALDGFLEDVGL